MKVSLRVRFLNFFRRVWMIRPLERWLASRTLGRPPDRFICKFVPNPYQYSSPNPRRLERDGIKMNVDISDYMGHYLYFGFDDPSLRALFSLVSESSHVIDVGANIGWTALRMSQLATGGWVAAFEPDPVNHQRCLDNFNLNSTSNLNLFAIALGSGTGKVRIEVRTPSNLGGNRVVPHDGPGHQVELRRLDDMVGLLPDNKVDLLKIDVEGYELEVLRGATELIKRCKPRLFIELDDNNLRDQGASARILLSFLESYGYTRITDIITGLQVSPVHDFTNCHTDIIAH